MRKACSCGEVVGYVVSKNGQDSIYCLSCKRFQYNAPKVETGRAVRSVKTVHENISVAKRAQVFERSNGLCELCGSRRELSVGHLLSVADGLQQGLTEIEINSDDNLAAMCAECNLGLGSLTVAPRLYVALLRRRQLDSVVSITGPSRRTGKEW